MFLFLVTLAGCDLVQDYETGLQLYCDAPRRCTECQSADEAAAWARDQLWNSRAILVWEKVAEFEPARRGPILRTAASQADIRPCAMAELYEAASP